MMWFVDLNKLITDVNPNFCPLCGNDLEYIHEAPDIIKCPKCGIMGFVDNTPDYHDDVVRVIVGNEWHEFKV